LGALEPVLPSTSDASDAELASRVPCRHRKVRPVIPSPPVPASNQVLENPTLDVTPTVTPDNQNRRLRPELLKEIRSHLPDSYAFTMEACTDNAGKNCVLGSGVARCSLSKSFFFADLKGHHIWMNLPFTGCSPFIEHYKQQKLLHPEISCVLILPERSVGNDLVQDWTLLHTFPIGTKVFQAPNRKGHFVNMLPTYFPVKVWFDPPRSPSLLPLADFCTVPVPLLYCLAS
jgi:hypothetical protein